MDSVNASHDGSGLVRSLSLSDSACPHEVANWGDCNENPFTPELLIHPCPVNKGETIETINNQSGVSKKYREVYHATSHFQISSSVASSSTSCALDCRKVDGCQSFKWTPEDNSCRMGGLVTEFESGEEDSDPVFIEMRK